MSKTIDCFFIGHNEMDFREYEDNIKRMGISSGAYRDLNLNFIQYDNRPYHLSEIFNLFYCHDKFSKGEKKPLSIGETFSAAIAYLGTYLNRRGFTFDYVNSFQEEKEELKRYLLREDILTIGIITTLYTSVFPIIEIIAFIKKYNHTAKVIVGGPYVSTQVLNQEPAELDYLFSVTIGADIYVNSSQGEATLVKILHSLKNDLPLDQINNIYYKTDNGYLSTPILIENNQLSENMVDWNLFADRVGQVVNVRTSISCPFSCAFCGFPEHAGKHQVVEVELLEKELKMLSKIKSIKSVNFTDDTFNVPKERFKRILKMLIKNKFKWRWHSNLRCQFLNREIVELMKESGCEGVFLGIESGSPKILKNMNKAASVDKYFEGVALLKEFGIIPFGSFIVGFPGETDETLQETVRFIEESEIDFFRAHLWYCEPITPIWREKEKYKIKGSNFEWSHATMDSRRACDLIDDMFVSIKKSIWIPQYNFDLDNLFHITNRGFTLEEVRNILNAFNSGIREKLNNPAKKEVNLKVIKQLKKFCQKSHHNEEPLPEEINMIDQKDAEFDFF
ncbi:MAG: PhpK family radical SAM P-methyltransferase [Candidatus Aminicenantes bacterium]|nr:MAG: PhpK family radical SAM P-methyltransferase [Candidatus Aminicenantes bacterium]